MNTRREFEAYFGERIAQCELLAACLRLGATSDELKRSWRKLEELCPQVVGIPLESATIEKLLSELREELTERRGG